MSIVGVSPAYLAIGHVTRDLLPGGERPGGTVAYAALTARALGWSAGVVTACAAEQNLSALEGLSVARHTSPLSTTYENLYRPGGRKQYLRGRAYALTADDIPADWRAPRVAHLAPLAQEFEPEIMAAFSGSLIGLTPQGWLREWDADGRVSLSEWPGAAEVLPRVSAAVISLEDVRGDRTRAAAWAALTPVLALTEGSAGCTVFARGREPARLPTRTRTDVDPTGAGDVFAAAFFVGLCETGNPYLAARLANHLAGVSVTRPGLSGTPTADEAAEARRAILGAPG